MEDIKEYYKPKKLKTVGHLKASWIQQPIIKPRIWVSKETLKKIKFNYNKKN